MALDAPRSTLVLGGARSGKSRHAERLLARHPVVTYVATGLPPGDSDAEWTERVKLHQERRPAHWETVETTSVAPVLRAAENPVLVDCLGTWLARMCDETGVWQDEPGWRGRLDVEVGLLVDAWRTARFPMVAVSNEVGSGIVPDTPSGRLFRDELGSVNRRLAEVSDAVVLMVAGRPIALEAP